MPQGSASSDTGRSTRRIVLRLISTLLRPLVTLMLRHDIGIYEFIELARWQFAHVAIDRQQFGVEGRNAWATSRSRCAILTGMTRRQVNRQLHLESAATEEARQSFHRLEKLLLAWETEPGYQDASGEPLRLPVRGRAPSLEQLVRQHCRDTPVRAVLDELVLRGQVQRADNNRIARTTCGVTYSLPPPEELQVLEEAAANFGTLLLQRFQQESPPAAVRETLSVPLAPADAARLQMQIEPHVQRFLSEIRQEFNEVDGDSRSTQRAVVGLYWGLR